MKKSVLFILLGVIFLLIAVIVLMQVFDINLLKDEEVAIEASPTSQITPEPTAEPIQELLRLDFEDESDCTWFNIHSMHDDNKLSTPTLENGHFMVDNDVFFDYPLKDNIVMHMRVKHTSTPDVEQSMFVIATTPLTRLVDNTEQHARIYIYPNNTPGLEFEGYDGFWAFPLSGIQFVIDDKWLDVILEYSEQDGTIKVAISNSEANPHNQIIYTSAKLPDDWVSESINLEMFCFGVDEFHNEADYVNPPQIDWVALYNAEFEEYIKTNVVDYDDYAYRMDSVLNTDMNILGETEAQTHGEQNVVDEDTGMIYGDGYIDGPQYNYNLQADANEYEILSKYFEGINVLNDGSQNQSLFNLDFDCRGVNYELVDDGENEYFVYTTGDSTGDVSLWRGLTVSEVSYGNDTGNVALYTEFKADKYQNHKFVFEGPEDIYVYFNREGMYIEYLSRYIQCISVPLTPHNSVNGFDLIDGNTYCMAVAFDNQGMFKIILWEKGNFYNRTYQSCYISGRTDNADTGSWKPAFHMQENNRLELLKINTFAFEQYTNIKHDMQIELDSSPDNNYGLEKDAALSEIMDVYLMNTEIKQEGFDFLDIRTYDGADVRQKNNGQSDYCVYTSGKGEGYFRTKTSIKEYCGGEKEQQGVYIEFDPKDAKYTYFEFQSDNEEDRYFIEFRDNVPYLFDCHTDERVYYETFNSQYMHLHHGVTYCMLVTFDENGQFNSVIWEKDNFYNRAECSYSLDKIASWHYCATLVFNNRMDVYDIKMFTFDAFQK